MSVKSVSVGNSLGNNTPAAGAGAWANLGNGDWAIGIWWRQIAGQPVGTIWQTSGGAPANYAALMAQANTLMLWDAGNNQATATDNYKVSVMGLDQASAYFGNNRQITTNGASNINALRQGDTYEPGGNTRELLVVQRRSGVSEIWRCRVGQTAQLVSSQTTSWTGFNDILAWSMCRNRAGTAQVSLHELDRPFHFAGRALSAPDITAITHGVRPSQLDTSGNAGAVLLFASISGAATDTATRWNPTAATTLTLNGVTFTFVASGATGNQVNIGAALSNTLTNLQAVLAASVDPLITVATYSVFSIEGVAAGLRIRYNAAGAAGGNYTLAASSANIKVPGIGKLAYCEWEYGPLDSNAAQIPYAGGGYLTRQRNAAWDASAADLAEPYNPDYVAVNWHGAGLVYQQTGGVAAIPVGGLYGGTVPAAVLVTAVDLSNATPVQAAVAVSGFTASAGSWSGTITLPKGKRWLAWRAQKQGAGSYTQSETPFGIGEVVGIDGQSLAAGLTKYPSSVTPNGFCSRFFPLSLVAVTDVAVSVNYLLDDSWHRHLTAAQTGGGEAALGNALSTAANSVVGMFNRSKGGTSITVLNSVADTSAWGTDLAASRTNKIGWMLWTHGHANAGQTDYDVQLDTLIANLRTYIGATFNFGILMLTNNTTSSDASKDMSFTRQLQKRWARNRNAVDPTIFELGDMIDLQVSGVDGIHGADGIAYARMGERFAAGVLWKMGVRAITSQGPRIIRCVRTGAVIDVKLCRYDGGTTLLTSGAGAPSGFDVSKDSFASLLAISSVAIVDGWTVRITLAADPGQEVDVLYLYGRPGKLTGTDTARGLITTEYSTAQANILYDGQAGFTYSANGLPVGPLQDPMRTVPAGHKYVSRAASPAKIANLVGDKCALTTDGMLQLRTN